MPWATILLLKIPETEPLWEECLHGKLPSLIEDTSIGWIFCSSTNSSSIRFLVSPIFRRKINLCLHVSINQVIGRFQTIFLNRFRIKQLNLNSNKIRYFTTLKLTMRKVRIYLIEIYLVHNWWNFERMSNQCIIYF